MRKDRDEGQLGDHPPRRSDQSGESDKALRDLIEIIHFTEQVSAKIHGLRAEDEIFRVLNEEFTRSKHYTASILMLTEDGTSLKVHQSSLPSGVLSAMEKVAGVAVDWYRIDLKKSSIFRRVIREDKTIQANGQDILEEILPRPLSFLVLKIMGLGKQPSVLTPLRRFGKTIGVLGITAPKMAEYFIPSVRNLSQHVTTALEFAHEYAERREAEKALERSERYHRSLIENAPDMIVILNADATIRYASPSVERIHGYTAEDLNGRSITTLIHPDDLTKVLEIFLDGGSIPGYAVSMEFRTLHKNGMWRYIDITAKNLLHDPSVEGIVVNYRDTEERKRSEEETRRLNAELMEANALLEEEISEHRQAEEEIRRRNRELAALNTIAGSISRSIDLDQLLEDALNKTLEVLSIEHGAIGLLDREARKLVLKATRGTDAELVNAINPIALDETAFGLMSTLAAPLFIDSFWEWVESLPSDSIRRTRLHPLKSAIVVPLTVRGQVQGLMCTFTLGERVFTEEEKGLMATIGHQVSLAVENAQLLGEVSRAKALEELDTLRTALLASVSHELRTPLCSIKGLASTLTQPDVTWDDETQKDFLRTIDRESDILTHIIEDLMEMSQMEAGIMRMEKRLTTITAIFNQVGNQLIRLTPKHRFEARVPQGVPHIYADEVRIGEVITNLVSNAVSYSDEGTSITLEAECVDGRVVVSVADEGIGIAEEHLDKIFDRFYRLESGVARRRGGTGLGLAICKGIVENHGGRIWVESTVGKGSRFRFSLPVSDGQPV